MSISANEPDWEREKPRRFWDPGRNLLTSIRSYQKNLNQKGIIPHLMRYIAVLRHIFWSTISGADIPLDSQIGGGLLIPHPNGIVIHPKSSIGPNCLIFQQVTLGARSGGVPRLGGHVDIGAGAKIIGDVTIGDHAVIGANAVVLNDVPEGAMAVGVPARVITMSD